MEPIKKRFFTGRVILSILAGVAAAILFMSFMRNYLLASVLGLLVAALIVRLSQPGEYALLGAITGGLAGLYIGARNYLLQAPAGSLDYPTLALYMLGGLLLTGLLCALYGFLTGKFLALYRQGRGPFF